jgi:hypothetical protein
MQRLCRGGSSALPVFGPLFFPPVRNSGTEPKISNRRTLRTPGSLPAVFAANLRTPGHELKFLIACEFIRNRRNPNKTNDGGHF